MPKWTEPVTLTFIKLYKQNSCLWTRQNNENIKRNRAIAWSAIAKSISELANQSVTPMECKQKIKCLMQKFRREQMKIMSEKGNGGMSDWSLYGELSFLESASFRLLKQKNTMSMPMLRPRRRSRMVPKYVKTAANDTLDNENEMNIITTSTGETKQTIKRQRNSLDSAAEILAATEEIGQTLRSSSTIEINTSDNVAYNLTTPAKRIEQQKIKRCSKRPKFLNVNIIHNPTPEAHRSPATSGNAALDSCHTPVQDECQCFGTFVVNKMRNYSSCTRSAVQHAISDILFKADMGFYDRVNSSATVNTQTETTQSNIQQWPDIMQLSYTVKSEDLSDLDDNSVLH